VEDTTRFLEKTLGYRRKPVPANSPVEVQWLDLGHGQELHVVFVEGFVASPFEAEFGRHVAFFHPLVDFPALRQRILEVGGELVEPLRPTPFQRLFFREPINGYLFEVIESGPSAAIIEEAVAKDLANPIHSYRSLNRLNRKAPNHVAEQQIFEIARSRRGEREDSGDG
jgi:hypothetical protein